MIPINLRATKSGNNFIMTPSNHEIITEFKGINPISATLNSSPMYNMDGARFLSSKGNVRNIVLTVSIFKNVQTWRDQILAIFVPGESVTLTFRPESFSDMRTTLGYVESINYDVFAKPTGAKQTIQISVMCYDPYFRGMGQNYQWQYTPTPQFQTIDYAGTAPTGFELTLYFRNISWGDYAAKIIVENERGEVFSLNVDTPGILGGLVTAVINTQEKTVIGTYNDLLGYLELDSVWMELKANTTNQLKVTTQYVNEFGEYGNTDPQPTCFIKYSEKYLAI